MIRVFPVTTLFPNTAAVLLHEDTDSSHETSQ